MLIEILLGAKAMIAAIRIDREIRDHQRTAGVKAERGQDCSQLAPGHHSAS